MKKKQNWQMQNTSTSEETVTSGIWRGLLKISAEEVCWMSKKSSVLKQNYNIKFNRQVIITRISWLCKESQNSLLRKYKKLRIRLKNRDVGPSLRKSNLTEK